MRVGFLEVSFFPSRRLDDCIFAFRNRPSPQTGLGAALLSPSADAVLFLAPSPFFLQPLHSTPSPLASILFSSVCFPIFPIISVCFALVHFSVLFVFFPSAYPIPFKSSQFGRKLLFVDLSVLIPSRQPCRRSFMLKV